MDKGLRRPLKLYLDTSIPNFVFKESKSLIEVRDWKKAVRKETEKLRGRFLLHYYNRSIKAREKEKAS